MFSLITQLKIPILIAFLYQGERQKVAVWYNEHKKRKAIYEIAKKLVAAGAAISGLLTGVGSVFAQGNNTTTSLSEIKLTPSDGFAKNPQSLINTIVSLVFVVGALLTLAYLIMGGIQWITAAGDKSKTESARNHITSALIGLLILAAAFAIFKVILGVIGINDAEGLLNTVKPLNVK